MNMLALTEQAPAKINLTLKVRGRRADGYHNVETLIAFAAGVADIVRLEPAGKPGLHVSGPFAGEIAGENLLSVAIARLLALEPRLRLGAVELQKRLPVAAGMGGGSADAAALLRAVRRANPELSASLDWAALAAALGADVTVCLYGAPAVAWGVGDRLEAIPALPRLPVVLANPQAPVPADKTARVFAGLQAPEAADEPALTAPTAFRDVNALVDHIEAWGNDLLPAATLVVPEIRIVREELERLPGCRMVGLSGAGPTCFAVFHTAEAAAAASHALRGRHPDWWIAAAIVAG